VLLGSGSAVMDGVLLASAIVPLLIVGVLCWVFFRAARRNDEAERGERPAPGGPPSPSRNV
jgi:hypothetical protein